MITHLFNSSVVSGPETLVFPALKNLGEPVNIIFLSETRLANESKAPIAYAKSLGHEVFSIPVRGRYDKIAFQALRTTIEEIKPKIVHAHDVKASVYLLKAKQLSKNFKPSIVSTHHGASYRTGRVKLYEEYYVRRILPRFDRVLTVCTLDQESVLSRGIAAEKIDLHWNGTNRPLVSKIKRESRQIEIRNSWRDQMSNLPLSSDAVFLGAVARLSSEKRHDRMLKVLNHLIKNKKVRKKIVLLCFGTGINEEKLKRMSSALGVDDSVFWMGYSKTIPDEMAGFDVLLSLSDGEGIPINLIEAGWAGTPVLATEVGGISDLIPSKEYGILVQKKESDTEIARALAQSLDNPGRLEIMGQLFQDRVMSHFSEAAWLTKLKQIYQKLDSAEGHVSNGL